MVPIETVNRGCFGRNSISDVLVVWLILGSALKHQLYHWKTSNALMDSSSQSIQHALLRFFTVSLAIVLCFASLINAEQQPLGTPRDSPKRVAIIGEQLDIWILPIED